MLIESAHLILNLEPFFSAINTDNLLNFNTGKNHKVTKTSYIFPASQDSVSGYEIFSLIADDLPDLTPITWKIDTKYFYKKMKKTWKNNIFLSTKYNPTYNNPKNEFLP